MSTQQILIVVGTVVGGAYGYPGLGAALGSLAGALLTPNEQGPKLDDLKANKVSYGEVIPYIEGHPRIAPVLAWQSTKQEIADDGDSCGGGVTQYSYLCDALFILGENQTGPGVRIWYNSGLAYNASADATDETIEASVETDKWRELVYYHGGPAQLPDPVYEAEVGDAPAFRGKSTMAVRGLKLLGPEGVFPRFEVEVAGSYEGENAGQTVRIKTDWAEADVRGDPPEGASRAGLAVIGITEEGVQTYRDNDTTAVDTIPQGVPFSVPGQGNGDIALVAWGTSDGICKIGWAGSGHSIRIDCDEINDFLGAAEFRFCTFAGEIAFGSSLPYESGKDIYGGCLGTQGRIYIHNLDGSWIHTHQFYPTVSAASSIALNETTLWVFDGIDVYEYSREDYLLKATIPAPTGFNHRIFISQEGALCIANASAQIYRWEQGLAEMEWELIATLDDAKDDADNPIPASYLGTGHAHHMVRSGSVYAVVRKQKDLIEQEQFVFYVNPGWSGGTIHPSYGYNSIGEILYKFAYVDGSLFNGNLVGWAFSFSWGDGSQRRASRFDGYEIVSETPFPGGPAEYQPMTQIDVKAHASRLYGYPGDSGAPPGMYPTSFDVPIYRAVNTVTTVSPKWYVDVYRKRLDVELYSVTEPTLEDVCRRQCFRGGLVEEDVNFTDLATRNVRAMAVTQIVSPDSMLDVLSNCYFFNFKESETLVGEFLGKDAVATIQYADLGADGNEPFERNKNNDLELPSQRIAKYMNVEDDYQAGSEESDRLISVGQSVQTEEIPIGFTPTEMKRIVDSKALIPAIGNRSGTIALSRKYSRLQAGDTVLVVDDEGSIRRVRFTRCTYEGGVYKFDWILDDAAAYTSDVVSSNQYQSTTIVKPAAMTEFEIIDTALLDDSMDGPALLFAAKGKSKPWPGYVMQRSPDGGAYSELYRSDKTATIGVCTTQLDVWEGPKIVDETNRVTVNVGEGKLVSITRDELYRSKLNLALVGDTVLQFQKARMISKGLYEISRFIYHTDPELSEHMVGEKFVLLERSKLDRVAMNLADFGTSKVYRAVTYNQNVSKAPIKEHAAQFKSLIPLAPVNLVANRRADNGLAIRARRRTRLSSNALRGIVPLGESTEQYEFNLYDGLTLKRHALTTSLEYVYTAAAIASDFPSGGTVTIEVRQLGARPGYSAITTHAV